MVKVKQSSAGQQSNGNLENVNRRHKLVLFGDSAVGKTSLVTRVVRDFFHDCQSATVGAAFYSHTVRFDDQVVNFDIWDTAGQERYNSLIPLYYRGSQAALLVYDIQRLDSFENVQKLVAELQAKMPNIVIGLAGNKSDREETRVVDFKKVQQYSDDNGLAFLETSARNNYNTHEIFLAIAQKLPRGGSSLQPNIITRRVEADRSSGCCSK